MVALSIPLQRLRPSLLPLLQQLAPLRAESPTTTSSSLFPPPPAKIFHHLYTSDEAMKDDRKAPWYDESVMELTDWFNGILTSQAKTPTSEAIYTPALLSVYDLLVWGFNSPFHWRIREDEIQTLYHQCLDKSENHAEIAVGTGLFLCNHHPTTAMKQLTLFDLNPNSLEGCRTRLMQQPQARQLYEKVDTVVCDILQPLESNDKFRVSYDSVGANFLFHCLHGASFEDKRSAFEACGSLLKSNGVFFGSTILGGDMVNDRENSGEAAMKTLLLYNEVGVFGNLGDSYSDLSRILHKLFEEVEIWRVGYCAVWKARGYHGSKNKK